MMWDRFTKKMREKIDRPRFAGHFTAQQAKERNMRLVIGKEELFSLYWLVDETDGIIADAAFQAFGPPVAIAIGEIICELSLHKNYDQVSRISSDLIDQHVRDKKDESAFTKEVFPHLDRAFLSIDRAVHQCLDIPFAATYDMTPIEQDFGEIPGGIEGWEQFPTEHKRKIIEEVVGKEIRPYIELDAGGIRIVKFENDTEITIAYEGSCTSCHSSTGSTLNAIQKILKARVHPSLVVIPSLGTVL